MPAAWSLVSGALSSTFGAGAAGSGEMWRLTVTTSWLAPVSSTIGWPMIGPLFVGGVRAAEALRRVAREADLGRARARRGRLSVVFSVGGVLSALAIVTVSWFSPVSTTISWPARNPIGLASRRPVAPTACAPLSVVRSALSAYWSITVARSANEVVTTNVFVYLAVLPAASWSEAVWVCLPTVSRLSGSVFGTMNAPSSVIRRDRRAAGAVG